MLVLLPTEYRQVACDQAASARGVHVAQDHAPQRAARARTFSAEDSALSAHNTITRNQGVAHAELRMKQRGVTEVDVRAPRRQNAVLLAVRLRAALCSPRIFDPPNSF